MRSHNAVSALFSLLVFATAAAAILPAQSLLAQDDSQAPAGFATQPYTPPGFHLPEGAGCSGEVARWQAIQGNDYASGNVNLKVYRQIQGEIARAAALCEAGRDREARAAIAASRSRHGYPP